MSVRTNFELRSSVSPIVTDKALEVLFKVHGLWPLHDVSSSFSHSAREMSYMLRQQSQAHQQGNRELSSELAQKILERRGLIQVNPSTWSSHLHRQILSHEKVHRLPNARRLIDERLGLEGMNKDYQAIVANSMTGRRILSNIFRFHTTVPETPDGKVDVRHLPGRVYNINTAPIDALTGKENVTAYCSISSVIPRAGAQLISDLSQVTPEGRIETTVSPIRGFTGNYNREELFDQKSDDEIRVMVLKYLVDEEQRDIPRNLHVGNGGYVAWVHINHDCPSNSEDWVTVNYLYDRSILSDNRDIYAKGKGYLPMSPILYQMIMKEGVEKVYNVCSDALVSKPQILSR